MSEPYYADDLVTLYHGDCLEVDAWLTAEVLVTDPPYGISWRRGVQRGSRADAGIQNDGSTQYRDTALAQWGLLKPGIVFCSWAAQLTTQHPPLVWRKGLDAGVVGSTLGYRRDTELIFLIGDHVRRPAQRSSVIETNRGTRSYTKDRTGPAHKAISQHPHAKPVALMERLIEWCPPGVIADPFAGSGSTLVAARNLGRTAIGIELDERYCEIIARRLDQGCFDFQEGA